MGYPELRQALREETQRQLAEIVAEAAKKAGAILDEAHAESARRREEALAAAARAADAEDGRAEARQRLRAEHLLLVEARRLLLELRAEAETRLRERLDEPLAARLRAELEAELDGDGWEIRPGPGGPIAVLGGRTIDNTLSARLERAWPALEPDLAVLLFGSPT